MEDIAATEYFINQYEKSWNGELYCDYETNTLTINNDVICEINDKNKQFIKKKLNELRKNMRNNIFTDFLYTEKCAQIYDNKNQPNVRFVRYFNWRDEPCLKVVNLPRTEEEHVKPLDCTEIPPIKDDTESLNFNVFEPIVIQNNSPFQLDAEKV